MHTHTHTHTHINGYLHLQVAAMGGGGPAFVDPNQRTQLHEGKTTWYVIMTALVAASGGLMFGWVSA